MEFAAVADIMPSIEPFIHRKVVVLHQDDSAQQAARAMCDRRIGCVVVGDHQGHVVGLVTDRDLVCGVLAYSSDNQIPLSSVMTPAPLLVDEGADLEDVIKLMEDFGIRRVPVVHRVSGRAKCVGLVTLDDLIVSASIETARLRKVVQAQVIRQKNPLARDFRGYRSQSIGHTDHVLNRFFNVMADKTGLDHDTAVRMASFALSTLIQRMHYTGAAHLIAQLPKTLQDELLDLPAGPDRSISRVTVISEMQRQFGFDEQRSVTLLALFGEAMESLVDHGVLEHIRAQLPEDLKLLMMPPTPVEAAA